MATPEATSSQEVKLRASDWKCRLMRNNSGALPNPETGVPVRFGLDNISKAHNRESKSSDQIGWTPVLITQEMIGKTIPVFTAIECKTPDFKFKENYSKKTREYGQNNFLNSIKMANGIAGFARSADDVDTIFKEYIKWLIS